MFGRFKKGAAKDGRSGLSIGDSRIALANVQSGSHDNIRLTASVFEDDGNNANRSRQLHSRLGAIDPRKSGITSVLPDNSYQVLLVEVPEVPADEINDAARWQIKGYARFSRRRYRRRIVQIAQAVKRQW